jgi:hypothetical protein
MRPFLVLFAALLLTSSSGTAQTTSRWTLSAGPEWTSGIANLWGVRLRADYDLIGQHSPLRFQLQGGARWGPTQIFSHSFPAFGGGSHSSVVGSDQTVDLTVGVVAAITPIPRARVAPYFTFGVLARQVWSYGWTRWTHPEGTFTDPERFRAFGGIVTVPGLGVRARIGGRSLQFEYRWLDKLHSTTFGTKLPF